jgi:hypothetical protein
MHYAIGEICSGKILAQYNRGQFAWKCFPMTSPWFPAFMPKKEAEKRLLELENYETPAHFCILKGELLTPALWRDFYRTQRKVRVCP